MALVMIMVTMILILLKVMLMAVAIIYITLPHSPEEKTRVYPDPVTAINERGNTSGFERKFIGKNNYTNRKRNNHKGKGINSHSTTFTGV